MAKAYVIRTQGLGIVHDKVYTSPPAKADLEKALAAELARHGHDAAGNPRKRWAMAQEVELLVGGEAPGPTKITGHLSKKESEELKAGLAVRKNEAPAAAFAMSGTGTVTNPGE